MSATISQEPVAQAEHPLPRYPVTDAYDEMLGADGTLNTAYSALSGWFARTPLADQAARHRRCERHLFDNFSDPQVGHQPWQLDLMPLVLSASTFATLQAAALQRMRLYELLLKDIYGEQNLIREGIVPAELVLNDPAYLRPVAGHWPEQRPLTFLALDLARDRTGAWRILDAHAETPAGHGFTLANRMVMSEVARDVFLESRASRISHFYQDLKDTLLERTEAEDPTIAILTGQAEHAADVGHAYMARYMGFMRVTGGDLRIVDHLPYLKTIDGLKRVDLLLRAVEGGRCDPLELAPDGFDGPVGLLDAMRHSPGMITNAIGSAVIQNRGLSAFLPSIATALLGEDLLIPDSPRFWLGEHALRQDVSSKLEDYIIHDANEGTGRPGEAKAGLHASTLDDEARAKLDERLLLSPASLVAENTVGFATAPTWTPQGLTPEPFALRIFVTASKDGYTVMPGGVALTIDDTDAVGLTSHTARSRDVWVVHEGATQPVISLRRMAVTNTVVQRHARDLQSRMADNLFWLGRYCERADATLRIVRQVLTQSAPDLATGAPATHAPLVLEKVLSKGGADPTASSRANQPLHRAVADALSEVCGGTTHAYGLPATLNGIRQTAKTCRDRLSLDSWRTLTSLSLDGMACKPGNVATLPTSTAVTPYQPPVLANGSEVADAASDLLNKLAAFAGQTHENMTRNRGWQFLDVGRRIERTQQMAELLGALFSHVGDPDDESDILTFALCAADSYMTFRSRYRFAPDLKLVLDLLVIDETNPRSIAYQLALLSSHVDALPKSASDASRARDQRLALDLLSRTRLVDVDALISAEPDRRRVQLGTFCADLVQDLGELSEVMSRTYFSLVDEQPHRPELRR